jgi:hypothetical protein
VEKSAKFRLNQPRADPFIVVTAFPSIERHARPGTKEISKAEIYLRFDSDFFAHFIYFVVITAKKIL